MIYHILSKADWEAAQANGIYEPESLETEGFIHCSRQEQVLGAASRYYAGRDDLLLLVMEEEALPKPPVWENTAGGTELFPHLYHRLSVEHVVDVVALARDAQGAFVAPEGFGS